MKKNRKERGLPVSQVRWSSCWGIVSSLSGAEASSCKSDSCKQTRRLFPTCRSLWGKPSTGLHLLRASHRDPNSVRSSAGLKLCMCSCVSGWELISQLLRRFSLWTVSQFVCRLSHERVFWLFLGNSSEATSHTHEDCHQHRDVTETSRNIQNCELLVKNRSSNYKFVRQSWKVDNQSVLII